MASSYGHLCGPCDARNITNAASVWCTSCEERLCTACEDHHKVFKATRQHQTIPISGYTSIEAILSTVKVNCEKHDRKFELYCQDHDSPCCAVCVPKDHKGCSGLQPIDEFAKGAKSSVSFDDVERGTNELLKTLFEVQSIQKENLESIQGQKEWIQTKIKELREKINRHLNNLETTFLKEIDKICTNQKICIEKNLKEIEKKNKQLDQLKENIKSIKESGTNIQAYLASKQLETNLNEAEKWTIDLCNQQSTGGFEIEVKIDSKLEDFTTNVDQLGKLALKQKKQEVLVGQWKLKEAQILVPSSMATQDIDTINLELQTKTNMDKQRSIQGCCLLPDGRMVFTDYYNDKLLVYDQDGSKYKTIQVYRYLHGITVADSNIVAVTCNTDQTIYVIEIDRGVVKKTITTKSNCSGISYYNGYLYVLLQLQGVGQYDVDGKLIRTIKVNVPNDNGYLSVFDKGFYFTVYEDNGDKVIIRCDMNGKIELKSEIGDSGVAVDQNGNVFVTSFNSHTLNIISADGQRHKCLLTSDDGMSNPEGIDFDKNNNTLLVVTDWRESAALYKVI